MNTTQPHAVTDSATPKPSTLTRFVQVQAVIEAGGRIEPTGERGLLRLLDASGREIPAWQSALIATRRRVR